MRRHFLRVHPDTHAEVIRPGIDVTHARHAEQSIFDEYIGVIVEERYVMRPIRRENGNLHELAGVARAYREAEAAHDRGEQRGGNPHAVLDIQSCYVNVGPDLERDIDPHVPGVGIGALHVLHARRAVDLLLNRSRNRLFHRLGIGAGILA